MDVIVPEIGESVASGVLTTWLKKDGENVFEQEDLFELETDKATLTVPSPGSGVLRVQVDEETEVSVGQLVASIEPGEGREEKPGAEQGHTEEKARGASEEQTPEARESQMRQAPNSTAEGAGRKQPEGAGQGRASPAARVLLEQHNLRPDEVEGTGRNGLVTKGDVLQVVKKGDGARQAGAEEHAAGKAGQPAREAAAPETGEVEYREQTQPREPAGRRQPSEEMPERREQLSRMKKRMAENLLQAVQSSAHVTTFNEIDLSRVITLRREYGDEFSERHGTRLGFMSFFVKASCAALFEYPVINASIDEDVIVYHQYANVGIAVSTERGLVVPVIRNAHDKSFARIESEIRSFASRAADKKLTIDELTGGTFSITNGGVFGSLLSTPIPNPPQMAILGMHAITNRPVAVGDQVAVRPMMYVALTYDHRYVEGREAVSFLKRVKVLLEDPQRLLIEV